LDLDARREGIAWRIVDVLFGCDRVWHEMRVPVSVDLSVGRVGVRGFR
jgi:hypothetical protein